MTVAGPVKPELKGSPPAERHRDRGRARAGPAVEARRVTAPHKY